MDPELSVVVPMFNEQEVLPLLIARLRATLDDQGSSYEVVAVDDGSSDLTAALLEGFRRTWTSLRVVRLRMNAGHQAALSAGLGAARGSQIVSMDADLQDPPELIPDMLDAARRHDADVVYGVRVDRSSDTLFKRWSAGLFYRLISMLTRNSIQSQSGDFRLMSRALVDAINALPETGRVIRFVVPALGFPSTIVQYAREPRAAGRTKYGVRAMVRLSFDSITGVSNAPLQIATYAGLVGGVLALIVGAGTLVSYFVGHTLPGWTSTVGIVSGFSALQLLCLGVLGEYIGRTYVLLQNRPTYFIAYDSLIDGTPATRDSTAFSAATTMDEPNAKS